MTRRLLIALLLLTIVDGLAPSTVPAAYGVADPPETVVWRTPSESAWQVEVGETQSAPVIADGRIYLRREDEATGTGPGSAIVALALDGGVELWRAAVTGNVSSTPAISDGTLYAADGDGVLALDSATGAPRWRYGVETTDVNWSFNVGLVDTPLVVGGVVVVAEGTANILTGRDGKVVARGEAGAALLALDPTDGTLRWRTEIVPDAVPYTADASRPIETRAIFVVDATTGAVAASYFRTADPLPATTVGDGIAVWGTGAVGATPVVEGELPGGELAVVDALTGAERWRVTFAELFEIQILAAGGDTLLAVGTGAWGPTLTAVDAGTGAVRWTVELDAGDAYYWWDRLNVAGGGPPTVAISEDEALVSAGGLIVALDVAAGRERWRTRTADGSVAYPVITGGVVVAATAAGTVAAYDLAGPDVETMPVRVDETSSAMPPADEPLFGDESPIDPAVTWQHRLRSGEGSGTTVLANDDGVFLVEPQGGVVVVVVAFEAATGAERWSARFPHVSGPSARLGAALSPDSLLLADALGTLHALDVATGRERWSVQVAPGTVTLGDPLVVGHLAIAAFGGASFGPAAAGGNVLVGGDRSTVVVAVDLATGEPVWVRDRSLSPELAGDRPGYLALRATDGAVAWRTPLTSRTREAMGWTGAPLVGGDGRFVSIGEFEEEHLSNDIVARDAATGAELWRSIGTGPATIVGVSVVVATRDGLTDFGPDGTIAWQLPGAWGRASLIDGTLYAPTGDTPSALVAIDPSTGTVRWRYGPGFGGRALGPVVGSANRLFAVAGGRLVALDLSVAARPLAATPAATFESDTSLVAGASPAALSSGAELVTAADCTLPTVDIDSVMSIYRLAHRRAMTAVGTPATVSSGIAIDGKTDLAATPRFEAATPAASPSAGSVALPGPDGPWTVTVDGTSWIDDGRIVVEGQPPLADAETAAGVEEALRQLSACVLTGYGPRYYASYSEAGLIGFFHDQDDDESSLSEEWLARSLVAPEGAYVIPLALPIPPVREVRLLPDGRAAALVRRAWGDEGQGYLELYVLVRSGDRWIVDATRRGIQDPNPPAPEDDVDTEPVELPALAAPDPRSPATRWVLPAAVDAAPVTIDGVLLVVAAGDDDGRGEATTDQLLALDPTTGLERWRLPLPGLGFTVTAAGELAVVSGASGVLAVAPEDGRVAWSRESQPETSGETGPRSTEATVTLVAADDGKVFLATGGVTSVSAGAGTVVVGGEVGMTLRALDLATGEDLWGVAIDHDEDADPGYPDESGYWAFDAESGAAVWLQPAPIGYPRSPSRQGEDGVGPVVVGDAILLPSRSASFQGTGTDAVAAFDLATGRPLWREVVAGDGVVGLVAGGDVALVQVRRRVVAPAEIAPGVPAADDSVIAATTDAVAIEAATGAERWRAEDVDGRLVLDGEAAYTVRWVDDLVQKVTALNLATGTVAWTYYPGATEGGGEAPRTTVLAASGDVVLLGGVRDDPYSGDESRTLVAVDPAAAASAVSLYTPSSLAIQLWICPAGFSGDPLATTSYDCRATTAYQTRVIVSKPSDFGDDWYRASPGEDGVARLGGLLPGPTLVQRLGPPAVVPPGDGPGGAVRCADADGATVPALRVSTYLRDPDSNSSLGDDAALVVGVPPGAEVTCRWFEVDDPGVPGEERPARPTPAVISEPMSDRYYRETPIPTPAPPGDEPRGAVPQEWFRLEIGGDLSSTPLYGDGVVYLQRAADDLDAKDVLLALDLDTGRTRWSVSLLTGSVAFAGDPVLADGLVILPLTDGGLVAIDASGGGTAWDVAPRRRVVESSQVEVAVADDLVVVTRGMASTAPLVVDGLVVAGGNRLLQVAAYEVATGRLVWETVVEDEATFEGDVAGYWALDLETGRRVWHLPSNAQVFGAPRIAGDVLVLRVENRTVARWYSELRVDPETGAVAAPLEETPVPDASSSPTPAPPPANPTDVRIDVQDNGYLVGYPVGSNDWLWAVYAGTFVRPNGDLRDEPEQYAPGVARAGDLVFVTTALGELIVYDLTPGTPPKLPEDE